MGEALILKAAAGGGRIKTYRNITDAADVDSSKALLNITGTRAATNAGTVTGSITLRDTGIRRLAAITLQYFMKKPAYLQLYGKYNWYYIADAKPLKSFSQQKALWFPDESIHDTQDHYFIDVSGAFSGDDLTLTFRIHSRTGNYGYTEGSKFTLAGVTLAGY